LHTEFFLSFQNSGCRPFLRNSIVRLPPVRGDGFPGGLFPRPRLSPLDRRSLSSIPMGFRRMRVHFFLLGPFLSRYCHFVSRFRIKNSELPLFLCSSPSLSLAPSRALEDTFGQAPPLGLTFSFLSHPHTCFRLARMFPNSMPPPNGAPLERFSVPQKPPDKIFPAPPYPPVLHIHARSGNLLYQPNHPYPPSGLFSLSPRKSIASTLGLFPLEEPPSPVLQVRFRTS